MNRKRLLTGVLACAWLAAWTGTGWTKAYVYKAALSRVAIEDGSKLVINGYLIFGDFTPVVGGVDDYNFAETSLVVVGGIAGKKKFIRSSDGEYRTVRISKIVNSKLRVSTMFVQAAGLQTDKNSGFENVSVLTKVLAGLVTDDQYDLPLKVAGTPSVAIVNVSSVAIGTGAFETYKLSLVRALTDASPDDETLAQATDRVAAFLTDKGLTEAVI